MTTPTKPTTGKPGRKAGATPKVWDYTGLDPSMLGAPADVDRTLASVAAPTRARDDRQVQIDGVVSDLHTAYVAAGKPERWATMPKRAYHVDPKAADTLRMLIRRAANFIDVSVRFGRPVRDNQGREIVVFGVRDKRAPVAKDKDTWTLVELREFALEFFGDDAEGVEDFINSLTGNVTEEDSGDDGDDSGEEGSQNEGTQNEGSES